MLNSARVLATFGRIVPIMANLLKLLSLCVLLAAAKTRATSKWWETASFYQIYPRSFKDSDGDGIGDLNGITEQLAYLKEIGITATWLSPIFTSPMVDFGYDIANFTEIDPMFGTMADFEALIKLAHQLDVKIIVDFVPNHSSDECEWFVKSAAGDSEYKDHYVWHAGRVLEDGTRAPPNNWISVFRGSMWTWHEQRQAYYLHQFHRKQPDLNYRNPKVRDMMKEVMRFWLRKGVAGFRADAVAHVFEIPPDANGNWPDEPRNEQVTDPDDYDFHHHIYTFNQQESVNMVYEFRSVLEEMNVELGGDDRVLMTEAYVPLKSVMKFYGNETADGAQIPFNFELISHLTNASDAHHYEQLINGWLELMPAGRSANWVLGNHDRSRIGSRFGSDRIDMLNLLLQVLPGASVTYNGEEIGMTDVWISWNDTIDPQGCQSNEQEYERLSRDPARTPFQWNDAKNAGFTNGKTTWLPISDNYALVNVKRHRGIAQSNLNVFKRLQSLRAEKTMRRGDTVVKALNDRVLAIKRSLPGHKTFIALLNIFDSLETINLDAVFSGLSNQLEYRIITDKSIRREGDKVCKDSIILLPKEAIVLSTS